MKILEGDLKIGQLSAVLFGISILYLGMIFGKVMAKQELKEESK